MADEVAVKEHCIAYDQYLELTKEKKELIVKYKNAKEDERISKMTKYDSSKRAYQRLNSDLELHLGSNRGQSAGARKSASQMSMEERIKMKDQLREWKDKKNEEDNKKRLDRMMAEKNMQQKLKKKLEAEREAKRNMV